MENPLSRPMINELLFRIIFSCLWVIFLASGLSYSLRAPKEEPSSNPTVKSERRRYFLSRALLAIMWWTGIISYFVFPSWVFLSIPLPDWLRLTATALASVSIPFIVWCFRTLGKNWAHALDPSSFRQRKTVTLVTSGPYRYVRNPMYLGAFIFLLGQALVSANWLILLSSIITIFVFYMQIGNEEKMLLDRFGDEYREYMKKTPRIIPKIR